MDEIQKAKEVFLKDVDQETLLDNQKLITEWEKEYLESEAFSEWKGHDITQKVLTQLKESYKDTSMLLATNEALTDDQRSKLFARKDAIEFLLSIMDKDAEGAMKSILSEVRTALNVT